MNNSALAEKLAYTEQPQYGHISTGPEAIDDTWIILSALGAGGLLNKSRGLINNGLNKIGTKAQEFLLERTQPVFKMIDNSLNLYGRVGKNYFKNNIQPNRDYSEVLKDYVYYPGKQAGKIRYKDMKQFPKLRENIRNSDTNLFIKNKKDRTDAAGFNNLKVNFEGEDYAYQVRNNPKTKHQEFYNIKPYYLAEKDYQEQQLNDYLLKIFENLPEK